MTIKPVINQKSNEKNKDHANGHNQVDQQISNNGNNHRNLSNNVESYSQSPQRRSDVFDDTISRHRRSPHKSGVRQKRNNNDHHIHGTKRSGGLNENREKLTNVSQTPTQQYLNQVISVHNHTDRLSPHSHSSVVVVGGGSPTQSSNTCSITKSPKHVNNSNISSGGGSGGTGGIGCSNNTSTSPKCQQSQRSNNTLSSTNLNNNINNSNNNNSNINSNDIGDNVIINQLEETLNGYNSGDEWLVPKENSLTSDDWNKRDEQFGKAMENNGLIIKNVEEDGACLFRSISLQIYGDQEMHDFIRQQTMDYIYQNSEYFAQFVTEDINNYVKRKRNIDSHGNHIEIQAMSELYNRPVELYCYQTTPINIFNSEQISNGQYPLRLSYQRGSHYNAIIDPYNASVGVGLGLADYKPPESQTHEAIKLSEQLEIEQTMFEDKLKTTDWEATNEALQEQVARESYLQWCRENILKNQISTDDNTCTTTSSTTSSVSSSTTSSTSGSSSSSSSGVCGVGGGSSTSTNSTITSAEAAFKNSFIINHNKHQLKNNHQSTTAVTTAAAAASITFTESCYITSIKTTQAAAAASNIKNNIVSDTIINCDNKSYNTISKYINNDDHNNNSDNIIDSKINNENNIKCNTLNLKNHISSENMDNNNTNDNINLKNIKNNFNKIATTSKQQQQQHYPSHPNKNHHQQILRSKGNNNENIASINNNNSNSNDSSSSSTRFKNNNVNCNDDELNFDNITVTENKFLNDSTITTKTTAAAAAAAAVEQYCDSDDTDMSSTSSIEPNSDNIFRLNTKNLNNNKKSNESNHNNNNNNNNNDRKKSRRLKRKFKELNRENMSWSNHSSTNSSDSEFQSKKLKIDEIQSAKNILLNTISNNNNKNASDINNIVNYYETTNNNEKFPSAQQQKILNYIEKQPSTSKINAENKSLSSFYQSLLESSYTDDGIGQLTEMEMIQKAIQMSRIDYFEDQKLKFSYFQVQHQDNDDDST